MDCEFSVELGAEDPTLAVPWRSPDGCVEYVDVALNPSKIQELSEVREFPELGEFLRALNRGAFATAKCDAWFDAMMDVDDEPYEARMKCASYVDVFFAERKTSPFEEHERVAREVVNRVRGASELRGRAEIAIRRAWFGEDEGLYWTVYVFGYGEDVESARVEWGRGLRRVAECMAL